jgi:hypothetical protein
MLKAVEEARGSSTAALKHLPCGLFSDLIGRLDGLE